MFGLGGKRSERWLIKHAPEAIEVIGRVSRNEMAVRMELEGPQLRFNTRLLLKDQVVLVGKPPGVETYLETGDFARFKAPWERAYEVRMEIASTHVNMRNQAEAFVCKAPSGRAALVQRREDRFNTSRFANLWLALPEFGQNFPIVDLSSKGCRIQARGVLASSLFQLNRRITSGLIRVSERFQIQLDTLVPRALLRGLVGLEFMLPDSEGHRRQLSTLLGALALQEVNPNAASPV